MRIVVTGSAAGMGHAIAHKFLENGHEVYGIDLLPKPGDFDKFLLYHHRICNIVNKDEMPEITGVNILINNAGMQGSGMDIDVNLKGTMNATEKYALNNPDIQAVLNQAAASAHMGTEYDEYVASKGGVIAYTRWVAKEIAPMGAVCNSLSFGGVLTEVNKPVTENPELWDQVMELTPLKHWTTEKEVASWVYFMTVINKSCSGQDIVIDNLESLNGVFVWE